MNCIEFNLMEKRASNIISVTFMRKVYNEFVHHTQSTSGLLCNTGHLIITIFHLFRVNGLLFAVWLWQHQLHLYGVYGHSAFQISKFEVQLDFRKI